MTSPSFTGFQLLPNEVAQFLEAGQLHEGAVERCSRLAQYFCCDAARLEDFNCFGSP